MPCTTRRASEAPLTRRPNASLASALVRLRGCLIRPGQLRDNRDSWCLGSIVDKRDTHYSSGINECDRDVTPTTAKTSVSIAALDSKGIPLFGADCRR